MLQVRRASERGTANFGWLNANYTFSFSYYYDPKFMGFRSLRVMNEDYIEGGRGFGTHGHENMEILTFAVEGALAHKDSTGGEGTLKPHEVQRMSAGTGVQHSEFNASPTEKAHIYQIWILPEKDGIEPSYEQKFFAPEEKQGKLKLVASRDARDGAVKINQDVEVFTSILAKGEEITHELAENRYAWLQIVKGSVALKGKILNASDGVAISEETLLKIKSLEDETEFLLFDLN